MTEKPIILLVDDDEDLLQLLTLRLKRAGFAVQTATSGEAALRWLDTNHPRAVITDLKMKEMDGLGLLGEIERRYPVLPVIVLTAHGTIPDAVAATRLGATAFLTKPIDDAELLASVNQATKSYAVEPDPGEAANPAPAWRSEIITRSPKMDMLLRKAERAAATDASIIIESPSGTGKELLARAIHAASTRAGRAFVTVNCSAIPEPLFESEVFGHIKGAFTDAHRDRVGLFRQADEGTLFLDEVGDMPQAGQAKLLRGLQQQSIRPVGSNEDISVNVRVISATNRDLETAIASGEFREDLYYRLNVIKLNLPTLEERREDIPLLAQHFLERFKADGLASGFSPAAMERLVAAPWPGNVRQLANIVQHCVVMCPSRLIPESLVISALRGKPERLASFAQAREQFEQEYLSGLLKTTGGNVSQAARLAGRNRSEFYKLLKRHDLDPGQYRAEGLKSAKK